MTTDTSRGRAADLARRHTKVIKTIDDAATRGADLSVAAIARLAGVDRSYLYRHRDLLAHLHVTQTSANVLPGTSNSASRESLRADLANCAERNNRLRGRVQQLERRLSNHLGEQTWQASGLGAPPDIETLHRRNNDLVQDNVELRRRLDERDQELAAARAANRELMIKANRSGP
jgi:hypothetical protein